MEGLGLFKNLTDTEVFKTGETIFNEGDVGNEMFVIQAPAGDYLIRSWTDFGIYEIVFRATETSLIYVGLNEGDQVKTAVIFPGTIFNESGDTWIDGTVTLFSWPGSEKYWWEVFSTSL